MPLQPSHAVPQRTRDQFTFTHLPCHVLVAPLYRAVLEALGRVLLKQIREVTAAGTSFTDTVDKLGSLCGSGPSGLETVTLKPAYRKLAGAAQRLEGKMQELTATYNKQMERSDEKRTLQGCDV